jgi:HSP20 family protein
VPKEIGFDADGRRFLDLGSVSPSTVQTVLRVYARRRRLLGRTAVPVGMRRDDRDDPFDDFFRELERMMNEMTGGEFDMRVERHEEESGRSPSRDVHLDIYEEDDQVRVVADIPGVEKDAIDLKCDGEELTIDASGPEREYFERVRLPVSVDEHSASATYNNGILEVSFERRSSSADIDLS